MDMDPQRKQKQKKHPSPKTKTTKTTKKTENHKYSNDVCTKEMSFAECELALLRHAVDTADVQQKQKVTNAPEVQRMIDILVQFLKRKKLVLYGGTAISGYLPPEDQFYEDYDFPDYDFFSANALDDARELADIYHQEGFDEVEAKSGVHVGTFKVFVSYLGVADITQMHSELFHLLQKEAMVKEGMYYAPVNYLRMGMYLELSRPQGDISRWEKVASRLATLNKHHPLDFHSKTNKSKKCNTIDIQRPLETKETKETLAKLHLRENDIYDVVKQALLEENVVFLGGYVSTLFVSYLHDKQQRRFLMKSPDFDVLSDHPKETAEKVESKLRQLGLKQVRMESHPPIGEILGTHYEVCIGEETVTMVYTPTSCHSYNLIHLEGETVQIASIETLLTFFLALYFTTSPDDPYERNRILCMVDILFRAQQDNRLSQKGVLKRFSTLCYGKQHTMQELKAEKAAKHKELSKDDDEYDLWFLSYNPRKTGKKGKQDKMTRKLKTPLKSSSPSPSQTPTPRKTRKSILDSDDDDDEEEEDPEEEEESIKTTPTPDWNSQPPKKYRKFPQEKKKPSIGIPQLPVLKPPGGGI